MEPCQPWPFFRDNDPKKYNGGDPIRIIICASFRSCLSYLAAAKMGSLEARPQTQSASDPGRTGRVPRSRTRKKGTAGHSVAMAIKGNNEPKSGSFLYGFPSKKLSSQINYWKNLNRQLPTSHVGVGTHHPCGQDRRRAYFWQHPERKCVDRMQLGFSVSGFELPTRVREGKGPALLRTPFQRVTTIKSYEKICPFKSFFVLENPLLVSIDQDEKKKIQPSIVSRRMSQIECPAPSSMLTVLPTPFYLLCDGPLSNLIKRLNFV